MPQTILFEGVQHQFPDDATDDEISGALSPVEPQRGATAASADSSPAGVGSIPTPATALGAVAGAIGQAPRLGPEEPTSDELAQLPPDDPRRLRAAKSFWEVWQLYKQTEQQANTGGTKIVMDALGAVAPSMSEEAGGAGLAEAGRTLESFVTPQNAEIAALGAVAPYLMPLIGVGFGAPAAKSLVTESGPEAWRAVQEEGLTSPEAGRAITKVGADLLITAGGAKGAKELVGRPARTEFSRESVDRELDDLIATPVEDLLNESKAEPRTVTEPTPQATPVEEAAAPSIAPPEGAAAPKAEPPSPIAGPALFRTGTTDVLAKGKRGEKTHADLKDEAVAKLYEKETPEGQPEPDAFKDIEHGFLDANGNKLDRVQTAHRLFETGEITEAQRDAMLALKEPGATSQDLQDIAEAKSREPAAEAPKVEPVPEVDPHLKIAPEVKAILDDQPAAPEGPEMKAPEVPPEGGAVGGTGGRRAPPPRAVGVTPRGDKNWLRIPPWFKRIGRGLFTEGARHVLGRTKNAVGVMLGKASRRHVDVEQELFGQHEKILRDAVTAIPKGRRDAAFTEVSQHIRDIENGRPTTPLAPDAQGLLDAWYDIGEKTGDIARANNVQVFDAKIGGYRPMGHVKNYVPRMFSSEVEAALRDPESNPTLYNNLAQAIATHRGIPLADAAAELNKVGGRFSSNDFHGNLELARSEQLPEIFYEYDLRNLASRYLPAFSERMGQIIAYGQRLGPRENPSRMNLWDIARRESRDADTQQWLNAAEDQATGFKAKSVIERNARRGQAIANATLLSDPTTTVVRNLLSGLAVTTERFGVGRSIRALKDAAKAAAGLDAKEMGALRDDIGSFLGAEQLGDSKLDSAIRGTQQTMLKASGFNASENFVRRHQAMTASSFARDAAKALSANPKSSLAREALAQFKRFDVDPELIVAEGGNWKAGPETRKYIRTVIRESQGGYRFDQVPVWAGTTAGRFLYQYGRWGIQRAHDIFKNTIRPALGETVEFRGQRMTRRNVLPLMRLGLLTVGLGEAFAGIASVLFNKDRRDSSFAEIGEAANEDEAAAIGLLGERVLNDVIMAGTLGLIGQPVDFAKSLKDQSRFKNPAEPPSLAGTKAIVDLAMRAKDQGGTLTKKDLLDTARSVLRGPTNVSEVVRNATDEKLYEAQNDQRTLRNAARRWAKSQGMDVSPRVAFDSVRKTLNAPVFEAINDALLSGDSEKAKQLRDEFVNSKKTDAEKKKARESVKSSVEGRHPFRAGPFASQKHQQAFRKWAESNLSEDDRAQIDRVIETYEEAAKKL
jgi:hypothetical protein